MEWNPGDTTKAARRVLRQLVAFATSDATGTNECNRRVHSSSGRVALTFSNDPIIPPPPVAVSIYALTVFRRRKSSTIFFRQA